MVWPDYEKELSRAVERACSTGYQNFVLNSPWQTAFFKKTKGLNLWAGPFCNTANSLAVATLASMGFDGAIVSPELDRQDYLSLPKKSPLPLGIVVSGNWPLCVSRILSDQFKTALPFASPKGEKAWTAKYGTDYWTFPNWKLDISAKKRLLEKAGYAMFVHLIEPVPKGVKMKKRPGLWNWELGLS